MALLVRRNQAPPTRRHGSWKPRLRLRGLVGVARLAVASKRSSRCKHRIAAATGDSVSRPGDTADLRVLLAEHEHDTCPAGRGQGRGLGNARADANAGVPLSAVIGACDSGDYDDRVGGARIDDVLVPDRGAEHAGHSRFLAPRFRNSYFGETSPCEAPRRGAAMRAAAARRARRRVQLVVPEATARTKRVINRGLVRQRNGRELIRSGSGAGRELQQGDAEIVQASIADVARAMAEYRAKTRNDTQAQTALKRAQNGLVDFFRKGGCY